MFWKLIFISQLVATTSFAGTHSGLCSRKEIKMGCSNEEVQFCYPSGNCDWAWYCVCPENRHSIQETKREMEACSSG
jgi:hypothetical protein